MTGHRGVRVVARKWGDRPHWEYDALRLGEDEHGTWLGAPAGTHLSRPGAAFDTEQDFVTLFPEDEFADHRVRFGYPDEVVRTALVTCDAVHAAVRARRPPYDGIVGPAWLDRLSRRSAGDA